MNNYTVYVHQTPSGKRYVGITSKKPEYRWNSGKGYQNNKHFYNAVLKYGWDNIKHTIIATGLSKDAACKIEQQLIKEYDSTNPQNGYNNSIGGESGAFGIKRTKESIERMKAHRDYSTSWAKGKHFTEEHRRRIGEGRRGIKMTDEARKKMSDAKKGYRPSWAGGTRDDKYRASKSMPVLCVETKITYFGLMEAERQTGISHANICRCLKGRSGKAGGYHWEYVNKETI